MADDKNVTLVVTYEKNDFITPYSRCCMHWNLGAAQRSFYLNYEPQPIGEGNSRRYQ
jgi:hypothetical protein